MLDPWNQIEFSRDPRTPLTEFLRECLKQIIGFSRELSLSVVLSAHPTKSGVAEGKIPGAYDIDGSAHWANSPDNILCVFRGPTETSIHSQKVREIGAGKRGVCVFTVDEKTGLFTPQLGAVST